MQPMTFGSLFRGVGGFDLALTRAGMRSLYAAEIDPKCNSVCRRHWPDELQYTDVAFVRRQHRPDLVCAGWPCQGNSVAGKRAGLADGRSGLWSEVVRVLRLQRPRWFLGENVPGLLSVNGGRDFGAVLRDLAQLGYGFAYRVLDAQWFGVPQRRRRVFVVGCLGDWRRAAEVLFEREGLPWDSPPRREAGTGVARCLARGAVGSGYRYDANGEDFVTGTLTSNGDAHSGFRDTDGIVTHTLTAEGHDAGEDGTGRGTPLIAYQCHGTNVGAMGTLRAGNGNETGGVPFVAETRGYGVRRLMPVECERLQGFPDDWTRYGADGEEIADSARYRMLGNAVAAPVVEWIGRRLMESANH